MARSQAQYMLVRRSPAAAAITAGEHKIKREYGANSALLRPDMIAGAFSKVLKAVTRPGTRSPGS
jgi:hypothetical protein